MQSEPLSPTLDLDTPQPFSATASSSWRHAVGWWIFRQRSWLPVPFALALVTVRWGAIEAAGLRATGVALVVGGELLRLWSVRHIGVISRTRAQRLGPLVATGPYLLSRNPLYIGNALLWAGFLAWSGLLWLGPPALLLFAVQYSLLAQWEERQLLQSFGESYAAYQRETPRWLPRLGALAAAWRQPARHSWPDVLFSERGTLIAVAIVSLLLIAKAC